MQIKRMTTIEEIAWKRAYHESREGDDEAIDKQAKIYEQEIREILCGDK